MKAFSSLLAYLAFLVFWTSPLSATPSCGNTQNHSCDNQKMASHTEEEKALMRSLRRRHTREAYEPGDLIQDSMQNDDGQHHHKGKKMTADERMLLRQQIDEARQDIYPR